MIYDLRKYTNKKIIIRYKGNKPKRLFAFKDPIKNIEISKTSLDDDIARSFVAVINSSGIGIKFLINGVPIFCNNINSLTYNVSNKDISKINDINYDFDREEFLAELSKYLWSYNEIKNGELWKYFETYFSKSFL